MLHVNSAARRTAILGAFAGVMCSLFTASSVLGENDENKELDKKLDASAAEAVASGDWISFTEDLEKRIADLIADDAVVQKKGMLSTLFYFRRVGLYFSECSGDEGSQKLMNWLLAHRDICWRFVNALDRQDNVTRAFAVMKDLFEMNPPRGEQVLARFGELAIAYAVVWDEFQPHFLARSLEIPDDWYKSTYRHYTLNNKRMYYDLRKVPWEISQYVVASAITPAERNWVMKKYNKRLNPAGCYVDVMYDYDAVREGRVRKMEGKDYTLINLRKFGGICTDRSYYAVNVARVYGIPAVYISGVGERGGHAWVGYIQVRGKSVDWNVRVGRFSYDHYYQGSLTDYTSGEQISDGELMMTAALFKSASASKRNIAAAYRDAAQWVYVNLMEGEEPGEDMSDWGIFAEDKNDRPEVDPKHARKVFSLAMESIKLSPYDKETWLFLGNLGKGGYLTTKQMDSSFALIRQLTLKRFPDFSFTIFKLLSSGISDTKQLNGVYEKGLAVFKFRPDLGANVKVLQGEMWEKAEENKKAAKAYLQAIMMFKTESHVVTMAFGKLDALYEKTSQKRAALQVYSKIWGTLKHPRTYNGYDMSLYKLMGDRLAELLLEGGLPKRSILVKGQMERVERSLEW